MAKGALKAVRAVIIKEALPAARAAVTVLKRHGGKAAQDWTKEYWKERRKSGKSIEGSDRKSQ